MLPIWILLYIWRHCAPAAYVCLALTHATSMRSALLPAVTGARSVNCRSLELLTHIRESKRLSQRATTSLLTLAALLRVLLCCVVVHSVFIPVGRASFVGWHCRIVSSPSSSSFRRCLCRSFCSLQIQNKTQREFIYSATTKNWFEILKKKTQMQLQLLSQSPSTSQLQLKSHKSQIININFSLAVRVCACL